MPDNHTPAQQAPINSVEVMDEEINLLGIAIALAKHKKIILGAPIIAAIFSIVFTLFQPDIYTADTKILPPQQQSSASAMLSQLGAPSGIAGGGGMKSPNDTYIAMLKSRTLQNNMIQHFKLREIYKTKTLGRTRGRLANATAINIGKDGIILISVDDSNPERAAQLANGYVDELQRLTQLFAVTEASQRRLFFEKQLLQAKQNLSDAEVGLKLLQEKTGIIQLDAQAQQIIGSAASLKGQIAMKEVELGAMRTFATGSNPDYIRTRQLLDGLRAQLAKVETGSITTKKVPEAGLEYIRKVRDLKYAETIYEMLAKQFEMSKIDEAKESSVIQVLDKAIVPEQKSKPIRSITVILSTIIVVFLAVLWALIAEVFQNVKKNSANHAQIQLLKNSFRWN